jgi:hypothetical protein
VVADRDQLGHGRVGRRVVLRRRNDDASVGEHSAENRMLLAQTEAARAPSAADTSRSGGQTIEARMSVPTTATALDGSKRRMRRAPRLDAARA